MALSVFCLGALQFCSHQTLFAIMDPQDGAQLMFKSELFFQLYLKHFKSRNPVPLHLFLRD